MARTPSAPRLALLITLTALALAALAQCDLVTASIFPSYLPYLEKSTNLEGYLGDPGVSWSRLGVMNAGSGDRLFLVTFRQGSSPRLIILDEDLKVLRDWSRDDLRTICGTSTGELGSRMMLDSNGDFVVGHFVINHLTFTPMFATSDRGSTADADVVGVAHYSAGPNYLIWTDNSSSPSTLYVQQCDSDWLSPSSNSFSLFPDGAANLWLSSAMRTYGQPVDYYFFVFGSYSNVIIAAVTAADFDAGALNLSSPPYTIIDTYPPDGLNYPWFAIENVDAEDVQFTVDGMVARTHEGERQLWKNGKITATFDPGEDTGEVDEVYSAYGKYYYRLDRTNKTLQRLRVWW
jgi:hypothetical protein